MIIIIIFRPFGAQHSCPNPPRLPTVRHFLLNRLSVKSGDGFVWAGGEKGGGVRCCFNMEGWARHNS